MAQSQTGIPVKNLQNVSSLSSTDSLLALTDSVNNTVSLISKSDLMTALISSTANNLLTADSNGLFVNNIIGLLENLETADKSNIVNAINELVTSISETNTVMSGLQTIQDTQTLSSGAITLDKTKSVYLRTPSANTTFTFTLASGTITASQTFTFELYVDMSATAYSLAFPDTVIWQDGLAPDLSATGKYLLVFRTFDSGSTWLGNLQGKW